MRAAHVVTTLAILLAACAAAPAPATPPTTPPASTMKQAIRLEHGKSVTTEGGLRVTFDGFEVEQIAPSPTNPSAYPAGSGTTFHFVVEKGDARGTLHFSKLSAGYTSHLTERWQGYEISLDAVEREGMPQMVVTLGVAATNP